MSIYSTQKFSLTIKGFKWIYEVLYTTTNVLSNNNRNKIAIFSAITLLASIMVGILLIHLSVDAQNSSTINITNTNASKPLPVLLIHGYMSDANL